MLPKRILVGYDGSAESKKALDFAVDLTKASGASLVVQHVVAVGPELNVAGALDFGRLEEQVDSMLEEAVERARQAGVSATKVLSRGDVATMILREAQARGVGMIVVGSLGRGRMARLLMGSIADKLVHTAEVPVAVVR